MMARPYVSVLSTPGLPRDEHDFIPWVSRLLQQASELGASDLHIDPQEDNAVVRLRIYGLLQDWLDIPPFWLPRLVSRLKVMAQMDLGERRLPQDGRILIPGASPIRVASLPTLYGEKLCLRLSPSGPMPTLADLHMPEQTLQILQRVLSRSDGLILITGPTGSGKTTTLYACLQALNGRSRHIVTVEDPVERILPGVNQTSIKSRIGLDFSTLLRSLLRHDPDVLMVGEVRDSATADMAIQAAETGHLVLTTLHTGTALEALTRLRHLGIANYLLASALRLILTQRLVRRPCARCRLPVTTTTAATTPSEGCAYCVQGYDGRIALFELVEMTPVMAEACLSGVDGETLQALAQQAGWQTLRHAGEAARQQGLTTPEELLRVFGNVEPDV